MAHIRLKDLLKTHLYQLIPLTVICKPKVCEDYSSVAEEADVATLTRIMAKSQDSTLDNFSRTKEADFVQWSLRPNGCLTNWVFPVWINNKAQAVNVIELNISDWLRQQPDLFLTQLASLAFHHWQTAEDDFKCKFNREFLSFIPFDDSDSFVKWKSRNKKSENTFFETLGKNNLCW